MTYSCPSCGATRRDGAQLPIVRRQCPDCRTVEVRGGRALSIGILIGAGAALLYFGCRATGAPLPGASSYSAQSIHREGLLRAIATVETGGDARAVGRAGERGEHQLTRAAWADACRTLSCRHRHAAAHSIHGTSHAAAFLGVLDARLSSELGRRPTTTELACAWRLGVSGFRRRGFDARRCPADVRDYVVRVENLMKKI